MKKASNASRNPLEQCWSLTAEEFTRRVRRDAIPPHVFESAREETAALTEEIAKVEGEIDGRVRGLYGVGKCDRISV